MQLTTPLVRLAPPETLGRLNMQAAPGISPVSEILSYQLPDFCINIAHEVFGVEIEGVKVYFFQGGDPLLLRGLKLVDFAVQIFLLPFEGRNDLFLVSEAFVVLVQKLLLPVSFLLLLREPYLL